MATLSPQEFPQVLGTLGERVNFNYSMFPAALCFLNLSNKGKLPQKQALKICMSGKECFMSPRRSISFMYKLWLCVHYVMCNVSSLCDIISMLDRGNDHQNQIQYRLSDYLSVSSVVHCKICRHSSCQHSQYDCFYVHQRVGRSIWDLLRDITLETFNIFKWQRKTEYIVFVTYSHNQMVWSMFGSFQCHSDL